MELVIDRVSKQYKNLIAVDRVSLKFHKGVYGLLGANGAGKTTLMRMICGIVTPTSGSISFDGTDARFWGIFRRTSATTPNSAGWIFFCIWHP